MNRTIQPICGRLEYDSRRNLVLFCRVPLRYGEFDDLTADERSTLIALKPHHVASRSGFGEERLMVGI
jgi:hypothetical protein